MRWSPRMSWLAQIRKQTLPKKLQQNLLFAILSRDSYSLILVARTVPPLWYFQDNAVSVLEHLDSWRRFFSRHQNFFVSVQIQIGRKNFLVRILAILLQSRWHWWQIHYGVCYQRRLWVTISDSNWKVLLFFYALAKLDIIRDNLAHLQRSHFQTNIYNTKHLYSCK